MKITAVEVLELEAPVRPPWRIATATMTKMYATVVRLRSDEGFTGIGECIVRLGPGATRAVIEEILSPIVIGRDPLDVEGIWDDMFASMRARGHSRGFLVEAMSGIDIALWDIRGKSAGLPVYRLLGAEKRPIFTYATGGYYRLGAPDRVYAEELAGFVAAGFRAVKLKTGGGTVADRGAARARGARGHRRGRLADARHERPL